MAYKFPDPPDITGIPIQSFVAENVDLTTSADVEIPNVPSGFAIFKVILLGITQTNFTGNGSFSIGDNATSYDNMMGAVTIAGSASAGLYSGVTLTSARSLSTGTVYTKISACTADAYTANIYIIGLQT